LATSALFPAFEADAMTAMIEREPLGEDNVPDLILMNYKGADFVGHKYAPDSDEMRVTLGEMDRQLKRMLSALEAKVGNDYLLAVTADHGMPPEPRSPERRHRHAPARQRKRGNARLEHSVSPSFPQMSLERKFRSGSMNV
jgi:predicted AlkP superfamily pyrophosphatase or phosphodiesterase